MKLKFDKRTYFLAGAAVAAVSAALVVDYAVRKKREKSVYAGLLIAGIAGLIGSAVLAYQPEKQAKAQLTVTDMLDDEDVTLVRENISEVLGDASASEGDANEVLCSSIEVDEDATVEDFI